MAIAMVQYLQVVPVAAAGRARPAVLLGTQTRDAVAGRKAQDAVTERGSGDAEARQRDAISGTRRRGRNEAAEVGPGRIDPIP
jgi:hypothetical protein